MPRERPTHGLAIDCETTGMVLRTDTSDSRVYNSETGERHQALSWGLIVVELDTLEPIEELYLELKWNEASYAQRRENPDFGTYAERIHGLTPEYLEENGLSAKEGATRIVELITRHWFPKSGVDIQTIGQNVALFDVQFLLDTLKQGRFRIPFGSRHWDTFSLAMGTTRAPDTDAMLEAVGLGERTGHHNALEDAKLTLEVFRRIRAMWAEQGGVVVES